MEMKNISKKRKVIAVSIKVKNKEIVDLCNFLLTLKMKGSDSRMRMRFIKLLDQHLTDVVNEEIRMLVKEYDGTLNENGSVTITDKEKKAEFIKEYNKLMDEEFIIEITESNKQMIEAVKNAVLNCDQFFSGEDAIKYDRYCDIFEGV